MFENINEIWQSIFRRDNNTLNTGQPKPMLGDRLAEGIMGVMEGASRVPGSKYAGGALDAFADQWSQTTPGRMEDWTLGKVQEYAPKLNINPIAATVLVGMVLPGASEAKLVGTAAKASKVAKLGKINKGIELLEGARLTNLQKKMGKGLEPALKAHDEAMAFLKDTGSLKGKPGGNWFTNPADGTTYLMKNKAASGAPPKIGFDSVESLTATAAKRGAKAEVPLTAVEKAVSDMDLPSDIASSYFKAQRQKKKTLKILIKDLNTEAGRKRWSLGHRTAVKHTKHADRIKNIELEPLVNLYDDAGNIVSRGNAGRAANDEMIDILSKLTDNPPTLKEDILNFADETLGNWNLRMGEVTDVKSFVKENAKREKFLETVQKMAKSKKYDQRLNLEKRLTQAADDLKEQLGLGKARVSEPMEFPPLSAYDKKPKAIVKSKSNKLKIKDKPKPKPTQELDPFDPRLVSRKSETIDLKTGQVRRTEDMTDFVRRMYEEEAVKAAAQKLQRERGRMIDVTPGASTSGPTMDLNDLMWDR